MRVDINQTALEVDERGAGRPVIFIHPEFSDLRVWSAQLDALAPAFRAIAYSRRHYHPNAPPPPGWENLAAEHVEDLAALMKRLRVARADLVGLSSGGLIALRFATTYPDLVGRLVIGEADVTTLFIPYEPTPRDILRLLLQHPAGGVSVMLSAFRGVWPAQKLFDRDRYREGVEKFMTGTIGARYFARFSPERVEQMIENAPVSAIYFSRGAPRSAIARADLEHITAPTLIIYGENSPRMHQMYARKLHDLIAGAQIAAIPDAAHFINDHNPSAFNAALTRFLSVRGEADRVPAVSNVATT